MKYDFRKDLASLCQSKLKTLAGINALNNRHAKKEKKVKKRDSSLLPQFPIS